MGSLQLGIDVGSTTIKAVLLDGDDIYFEDYRRHHSDVRVALAELLDDVARAHPGIQVRAAVTGSGGVGVSEILGIPFVQEVIAETEVVEHKHPEVDVIIELGGEDAKLTYLHPTPEQRMNGTCAGGTGAFIDQMASLLNTDAAGLNDLAANYETLYPIASRCGVFAKSDVQPLLNQGVAHEDIAASVFQSVATQTIAGLANGRPIRGTVMLLGGPLHFMPELRKAYHRSLDKVTDFVVPERGQLYVAIGAAMLADGQPAALDEFAGQLRSAETSIDDTHRMPALFDSKEDYRAFVERHNASVIEVREPADAHGNLFLGIDAGSTTIKAVCIDEADNIVFTHYASNEGSPLDAAIEIVDNLQSQLPEDATIVRGCSTGYGEGLVKTALGLDEGIVETMAHYRAAAHIEPEVSTVIDIGGQDMKYLKIKDGTVDSISVNESCSSGCGSFLQTFASGMNTTVQDFADRAVHADAPVDLGTRCTVFMNSSVKQAQKEGASTNDIAAGLAYSVVRNALYKVIKLKDADELGPKVVVQGGTFLNDGVLRAFEELTGREVIRPNVSGLMGAFGAALTAKLNYDPVVKPTSDLLSLEELRELSVETEMKTCKLCQNHCQITISNFSSGERHVAGNRCERGASLEKRPAKSPIPNLYDWKYKRVFAYRRLLEKQAHRGDIGIPRVLNMYEDYPFWATALKSLGFRVIISKRSNDATYEKGMESIPSENICYPAKLVHGHIEDLLDKNVPAIFYPCIIYNEKRTDSNNSFNCPIVATYPEVIRNNMERLIDSGTKFISPFLNLNDRELLPSRLVETFADYGVTLAEAQEACRLGYEEMDAVRSETKEQGRLALQYCEDNNIKAIVLAGRPYHLDPEINHGIPEMIVGLGAAVLTEDSIMDNTLERPLRVLDQWAYHSRLYEAADTTAKTDNAQLVQLVSFGCGIDAITAEQVQDILEGQGDIYTSLKIDEVSNLGAARIRLRSLTAAVDERDSRPESEDVVTYPLEKPGHIEEVVEFTEDMRKDGYEILVPQLAPIHLRLLMPVFQRCGLNARLLETPSNETMETGLKFVNNDICHPAVVVIGQLIDEFLSGRADPDRTAVAITQAGGMCRATNYTGLLRKGLRDAGFEQVPVLSISAQGFEAHSGFKVTPQMAHSVLQGLTLGDVLQTCLLRTRPYQISGNVSALYAKWDQAVQEFFEHRGYVPSLSTRFTYSRLVRTIVREFDTVELQDVPRRPRVGVLGEILVQYNPYANNNAVATIETEGCEAVLPPLAAFFQNGFAVSDWTYDNLGISPDGPMWMQKTILWALQQYEKPARAAIAKSERFDNTEPVQDLAEKVQEVCSLGNQSGEGWYLPAEMMSMAENGVPNIICAQPFGCLPNHVIGKGMFRAIRTKYPQANIVGIDYDPGASEVNQLNRIKLMISTAFKQHQPGDDVLHFDETIGTEEQQAPTQPKKKERVLLGMPGVFR